MNQHLGGIYSIIRWVMDDASCRNLKQKKNKLASFRLLTLLRKVRLSRRLKMLHACCCHQWVFSSCLDFMKRNFHINNLAPTPSKSTAYTHQHTSKPGKESFQLLVVWISFVLRVSSFQQLVAASGSSMPSALRSFAMIIYSSHAPKSTSGPAAGI